MAGLSPKHIQGMAASLILPNVLGYSASLKPRIRQGRVVPEEEVIRIYVVKKAPLESLAAGEVIPKEIEGIPVDVVATGEFQAQPYTERERPVRGGWSCGNEKSQATGTIGCIVSDGRWEGPFSNNHVLARCSNIEGHKASVYEGILQPGALDGGTFPNDLIAFLTKWTDLSIQGVNKVDRAMGLFTRNTPFRVSIQDMGLVRGLRVAEVGLEVAKTGRSSGYLEGKVFDTDAFLQVSYGQIIGKALDFEHQILIAPSISIPGDSGSLVLDKDRKAIGLLFAGSPEFTAANHIAEVLDGFGVEIVGAPA